MLERASVIIANGMKGLKSHELKEITEGGAVRSQISGWSHCIFFTLRTAMKEWERRKRGKAKEWASEVRVCWIISLIPKQTPVSHMKVRATFLSSRTATQVLYCARVWVPLFQPMPMIQLDRKLWNSQPAHSSHSNSLAKHTVSLSLSLRTPSPTRMLHTVSSQL